MTKQEELREDAIVITKDQLWREGIRDEQRLAVGAIQIVDGIFGRLNEKGVVIKVERELPDVSYKYYPISEAGAFRNGGIDYQDKIEEAGYVAVEPLIKEEV